MKLSKILDTIFLVKSASAHCDVPCGIYDPHNAQLAAATVLRMTEKIKDLPTDGSPEEILLARNNFVRMVWTKEEHARKCKEEILVLWTDYFKPEHLERWPNLHDQIWKVTKLISKTKQNVDEDAATALVKAVNEIADIFHQSQK